jgi:hypothetical protein
MTLINETTDRATLEVVAIFDCEFDLQVIEAASDADLLDMITDWIAAGDECAQA